MVAVARKYDIKYEFSVERITITIDNETLSRVKGIVGRRGVSKFIAEAVREKVGRNQLYAWFDEMDAKYGKPSKKLVAAVDRDMRKIFGL